MSRKTPNKPLRIDLTAYSPEELADFLKNLLGANHQLHKLGLKLRIKKHVKKPLALNVSPLK